MLLRIMLNINDGNNEELKKSCQTLREYMLFVNRIRKYICRKNFTLNQAVELAVTECIQEGILQTFLAENRAEVIAMSIFEFDKEKEWKKYGDAEYQYGMEAGIQQGIERLLKKNFSIDEVAQMLEVDNTLVEHVFKRLT